MAKTGVISEAIVEACVKDRLLFFDEICDDDKCELCRASREDAEATGRALDINWNGYRRAMMERAVCMKRNNYGLWKAWRCSEKIDASNRTESVKS